NQIQHLICSLDPNALKFKKTFPEIIFIFHITLDTYFRRKQHAKDYGLYDNDPPEVIENRIDRYRRCSQALKDFGLRVIDVDANLDANEVYEFVAKHINNIYAEFFDYRGSSYYPFTVSGFL